ncbi:choice-of-anchor D domain-containing protein, partial [bacterium]|nr:choice-of-anchor D domain-containing protein [bacterium]
VFNNSGTTQVETGTLTLQGGDGGSTTGDFNVSSGATLNFASSFNLASSVAVAGVGTVDFSAGTIEFDGALTSAAKITGATVNFNSNHPAVPSINLSGGTLGGPGDVALTGLLTWTGGTMNGAGSTTANGGILMDGGSGVLTERTLYNPSGQTATMSNAGYLYIGGGAIFNNAGTFLAQVTQDSYGFFDNVGGGVFNNSGTFTRNTGTGSFAIASGIVFNNTGATHVQTGTLNLQAATVTQYSADALTAGIWFVGPGAQLSLPSTDNGVVTNQADITLSGNGSVIISGPASSSLESTLTTSSGQLRLLAGRSYTATAGAFSNTGILQLGGGTYSNADGLTNADGGEIFGFGAIAPRPTNSGIIRSAGGPLDFSNGIQGGSGTVQIDVGSSMNLSAGAASGSSADFLIHNGNTVGSLNLGTRTFAVGIDYTNANFGTGNAFAPRANVSGSGGILAVGGTGQTVSGNVTSGATATPVMAFGKLHLGAAATLNYQLNNTGASGSRLRGALQTNVNGGNLSDARLTGAGVTAANFGPILPGGNSGGLSVTFTASSAGALTGQAVRLLNHFDNVAEQTLSITGSGYRYAAPGAHSPTPVAFGNFHVGDTAPTQLLTLSNQAANDGFSEALNASIGGATGGVTTNGGSFTALSPGSSNGSALSVGIGTATAGSKNGTATISLTSNGAGSSDLGLTALTSQTVTVTGSVFRLAQPVIPGGTSLNFGIVHVGETAQQTVTVNNTAANDGFSESLNGSFSANTGHLTGSGSFVALAPAASSSVPQVTLDTSTAG